MAAPRTHGPLLEQPRRSRLRLALIAALIAVTGVAVALVMAPRRERVGGHAYPIPSAAGGGVQVEVLNGTRRAGYARSATRLLRRRGLDVVYLGNADSLSRFTRVLVRRGDAARGRKVAEALGVPQVLIATDTLRRVDVSVILGEDFRPAGELHP